MPANPAGYAKTASTRGRPLTPKRKRSHQIALRLNDRELCHLNRQSNLSGLSREAYIRSLIMGSELHPRPCTHHADLLRKVAGLCNNANQLAHQIGVELADQLLGGRYQAVVTTHLNTRHIHNHIVWCAVALDNGRKYHSNAKSYYTEVRARSDALCRQYGLSVIETERSQQSSQPYAEWQAGQTGQPTWRSIIRQDVDDAIARSLTWRQFVQAMEQKGYTMQFNRKYPILQPPDKTRPVRFKTLGKRYTPEAIRNRILYPRWRYPTAQQEPVIWHGCLHGAHRKACKLTGLWALYYRYLYELGALPRKPHRPSYAVRQDIRNLDKRIRQMEFLSRHEIDTLDQLDAYRQAQEQAVANLLAERRQLHCAEPSDEIKARQAQITQALKSLRQDIRLCRQIAEHSVQMRELLKQRAEKLPEQNPEQDKTTERDSNREPNQTR